MPSHLVSPGLRISGLALSLILSGPAFAGEPSAQTSAADGFFNFNPRYSDELLDKLESVTAVPQQILEARAKGEISNEHFTLSGRLTGVGMFEETNTEGKFPILSRLPPQHSGFSGEKWVTNEAALGLTTPLGDWVTLYQQLEYTQVAYPGQDDWQMRKAYALFGNLKESPFYASIGKNTVEFGDFKSFSPLTMNHSAHYFWAQTGDVFNGAVGYYASGWDLVATALHAGRGLRTINTRDTNGIANFALNASKEFEFGPNRTFKIGGGYLHSTIYNDVFGYHPPGAGSSAQDRNGAWDINTSLVLGPVELMAEYSRTLDSWPATDWPVSAFTVQGRYSIDSLPVPAKVSLAYSIGVQGESGTEWEKMEQVVAGLAVDVLPNLEIDAEYVHNVGFVPLIAVTTVSDRGVESDTWNVGAKAKF